MLVCGLDLETTGTSNRDRIVQVACIVRDLATGTEVERFVTLVNPGIKMPPEVIEIHGITDEMVAAAPKFAEVAKEVARLIDGKPLLGQNVRFDIQMLHRHLVEAGLPGIPVQVPVLDTLTVERYVNSHKLGATYKRYTGKELDGAHDASKDVEACFEVLQHQLQRHAHLLPAGLASCLEHEVARLNGEDVVEYLDHGQCFYKDDKGQARFSFGKWKDEPASYHPDYLSWMVQKGDFESSTKEVAIALMPKVAYA